ncbi:type I polyketide synthase [Dickeya zeae]|uniref:type I polyketide synthase n=1 Tax=Dickeya zeae TaxID=204042 RepID=UPI0002E45FFE|nr:type I polyketide synthase [Dickeya zeae]AJC65786.1 polyketide synthase [Dickeya zeae EC1]
MENTQAIHGYELAIIGMAGVFPGAEDVAQFWHNLVEGVESIRTLSDDELEKAGIPVSLRQQDDYMARAADLAQPCAFDAAFFGYSPREAEAIDPQQRVFLEVCWHALENAGYVPEKFDGQIGIFASSAESSYLIHCLADRPDALRRVSLAELLNSNNRDFVSTRVAYKLNLHGPAMTLGAACASSLLSLHYACQSLLVGECDIALAGGVHIGIPDKGGYHFGNSGILSHDGHCRPFDADASGMIGGDGAGAIVIKRLQDALDSGDTIAAIIKGSAVSNDGSRKLGFSAPSVAGQAEALQRALLVAGVTADSVSYIEAHGTGTHLGDPIEVKALKQAYQLDNPVSASCAIASVKANVGHLDSAAGVTGVIKVAQMLQHGYIPPAISFTRLNPEIELDGTQFYIPTEGRVWQSEAVRRAGVSAFGIGGTNAHVILEESRFPRHSGDAPEQQLLCFSGHTPAALQDNIMRFHDWLAGAPQASLADAAYTLHLGRSDHAYRASLVVGGGSSALPLLAQYKPVIEKVGKTQPALVFMFSGQGSQYPGMMAGVYSHAVVFRETVDQCAALLQPLLGQDIRPLLFNDDGQGVSSPLYQTRFTQPALFVTEYALSRQLMDWGITPTACIGHSIGEYVAACLAGVFSLEDALMLVCRRGELMNAMPVGSMLALGIPAVQAREYLGTNISLAASNAPEFCVVAGPSDAIEHLAQQMRERDVETKALHTSHAFHSSMMDGCLSAYRQIVERVMMQAPQIPFISCVTGDWITNEQATDPEYWVRQLRESVAFNEGIACLLNGNETILLEVGPGKALTGLASLQPAMTQVGNHVLSTQPDSRHRENDYRQLLTSLGQLWQWGCQPDWRSLYRHQTRCRIPLPGYAFQRQVYDLTMQAQRTETPKGPANTGERLPLEQWASQPCWQQKPLNVAQRIKLRGRGVVIFMDKAGVAERIAEQLEQQGARVCRVVAGKPFSRKSPLSWVIDPALPQDLEAFASSLRKQAFPLDHVIMCWPVARRALSVAVATDYYECLLNIARQFTDYDRQTPLLLHVISNALHVVTPDEQGDPARALLVGPCRVLEKEFEQLTCRSIDIDLPPRPLFAPARDHNLAPLMAELTSLGDDSFVALRGGVRYIQSLEPIVAEPVDEEQLPVMRHGRYLLTGGFGGIGMTIAQWLAQHYQAHVILLGRSDVPPEPQWQQWLDEHSENNDKSLKIKQLQKIKQLGGTVSVIAVDLGNTRQVSQALKAVSRTQGMIHGVFHCAGIADGRLIQQRTAADSLAVFNAKVQGTLVLERYFRRRPLDFFVQCSSLAATVGPMGQVAYCSANAYQDAWAIARNRQRTHTRYLSVGWDSWQEVGMAVDSLKKWNSGDTEAVIRHGIRPQEGSELMARLLARQESQYVISTRGLPLPDADTTTQPDAQTESEELETQQLYPRPPLANAYIEPRDAVETTIARIWQEKMGIGPIGIEDDFFELNGHSLMAVQIIAQIRQQLAVSFPVGFIYDYPTIAGLAGQVRLRQKSATPPLEVSA